MRYAQELAFDLRHRVDTRGVVWGTGDEHSVHYQGTDPREFHALMRELPADAVFVDLGSGKGKAVLLAAGYGFRRAIGVEISPALTKVAQGNLRSYTGVLACPVEFVTENAERWLPPLEPVVLYVHNPFDATVLERVLQNLTRSLTEHPREATVVYHAPFQRQVTDAHPALTPMVDRPRWVIYRAGSA